MTDEYYVYPVLPGTDYRQHTESRPFCHESDCQCHEDEENLKLPQQWYNDGLLGAVDGDHLYHGRTI